MFFLNPLFYDNFFFLIYFPSQSHTSLKQIALKKITFLYRRLNTNEGRMIVKKNPRKHVENVYTKEDKTFLLYASLNLFNPKFNIILVKQLNIRPSISPSSIALGYSRLFFFLLGWFFFSLLGGKCLQVECSEKPNNQVKKQSLKIFFFRMHRPNHLEDNKNRVGQKKGETDRGFNY